LSKGEDIFSFDLEQLVHGVKLLYFAQLLLKLVDTFALNVVVDPAHFVQDYEDRLVGDQLFPGVLPRIGRQLHYFGHGLVHFAVVAHQHHVRNADYVEDELPVEFLVSGLRALDALSIQDQNFVVLVARGTSVPDDRPVDALGAAAGRREEQGAEEVIHDEGLSR